jgi:hypothetical protein
VIKLYRGLGEASIIMGDNGSTPLWVAEDGSWGTSPITIFDAHHWTARDFAELDEASDSDKAKLAHTIADEAKATHDNSVARFVEETRDKALQLGIRMFRLTGEGMEELV